MADLHFIRLADGQKIGSVEVDIEICQHLAVEPSDIHYASDWLDVVKDWLRFAHKFPTMEELHEQTTDDRLGAIFKFVITNYKCDFFYNGRNYENR